MYGKDVPAFHFQDITYNIEIAFFANDMDLPIKKKDVSYYLLTFRSKKRNSRVTYH